MMFSGHRRKRLPCLIVLSSFILRLMLPSLLLSAQRERIDERLFLLLAERIHHLVEKTVAGLSRSGDNRVALENFLYDRRHRIFIHVAGHVRLPVEKMKPFIVEKIRNAVGSCLSTNGSVALDFAVKSFDEEGPSQGALGFDADLVINLKSLASETCYHAANIVGALTIGKMLSRFADFVGAIDGSALGEAIRKATSKLWALGAGKLGFEAYDILDRTGQVHIKELLLKSFTIKSLAYHLGVFVLQAGVSAGATFARLSFGAAVGTSLAGSIGAFVGSALAVVAVIVLGDIIVGKLTRDLPLWWRFRRLAALFHERETASGEERNRLEAEMDQVEEKLVRLLDEEIALDSYSFLDKLIARIGRAYEENDLAPYEGVVEKIKSKLSIAAVHDENWNAARKYYQLLRAIGRLPGNESTGGKD